MSLGKATILTVDDDVRMLRMMKRTLELEGYRVLTASNGEVTLDVMDRETPCLVLLDIKMPRMDGIEVLEAIRSDDSLKMLPVVMLTSSREEPDLKRCYELGVNAYVVKPVDFRDFQDAVKHLGVFWAILNERPTME